MLKIARTKIREYFTSISFWLKSNKAYFVLCLLFFILPFLIFICLIFISHTHITNLYPGANDELGWFNQIKSVVAYGKPLGYKGYNETHALIGTFGPWGAVMTILVSFGNKLLGCKPWSPMVCNALYWCFANLVFIIFTHPNKKQLTKLIIIQFFMYVNILYMFTSMAELTRYSMAIICAGMFYYLLYQNNNSSFVYNSVLYVVAPIVLCIFAMAYAMFSFCFFIYGYLLFRKYYSSKFFFRQIVLFCIFIPILLSLLCYCINRLTVAPFSQVGTIGHYLSCKTFNEFIIMFFKTGYENFRRSDLIFIINHATIYNGRISSYMLLYYIVSSLLLINMFFACKTKNRKKIEFSVILFSNLIVYIFAHWFLYEATAFTYIRGCNVAFNFTMYLVCLYDYDENDCSKSKHYNNIRVGFICLVFLSLMCFLPYYYSVIGKLKKTNYNNYKIYKKYETIFVENIEVLKKGDPWDNTVAVYGKSYNFYSALPAGISTNSMSKGKKVEKSKYILKRADSKITISNYEKIYSDKNITLYRRK